MLAVYKEKLFYNLLCVYAVLCIGLNLVDLFCQKIICVEKTAAKSLNLIKYSYLIAFHRSKKFLCIRNLVFYSFLIAVVDITCARSQIKVHGLVSIVFCALFFFYFFAELQLAIRLSQFCLQTLDISIDLTVV